MKTPRWQRNETSASATEFAAQMRELVVVLRRLIADEGLWSVAVASMLPGEGRSTIARHVAESLARETAANVLLVDAADESPSLHEAYDLPPAPGLAEVLGGTSSLSEAARPTENPHLHLLPVGAETLEAGESVTQESIAAFCETARRQYDLLVLDTAPLKSSHEAVLFCSGVSGVLLVLLAGATPGEEVTRAERLMVWSQSRLLGVVINDPGREFLTDER